LSFFDIPKRTMAHKPPKKQDFLTASVKIGSCKGPIDYKNNTQVFHPDDVPKHARERREQVADFKKAKILSNAQPSWKTSTHLNRPMVERRTMENHTKDRSKNFTYNYRAESLDYLKNEEPVDKPTKFHLSKQLESQANDILQKKASGGTVTKGTLKRTEEMPIHPTLESATWNSGTVRTVKEHEADLEKITKKAVDACYRRRGDWQSCRRETYTSPPGISVTFQDQVRQEKQKGAFEWRTCVARARPTTSSSVATTVNKKQRFKPENVRQYGKTQHSGTWEFSAVEGRYMWSDTGSFDYHSKGDICKYDNPNSFNYSGPDYRRAVHTLN
jgi:hypothetical protein